MKKSRWTVCCALALLVGLGLAAPFLKRYAGTRLHLVMLAAAKQALNEDARNLRNGLSRYAGAESSRFIVEQMPPTRIFMDRYELLSHCLESVAPKLNGSYCEFGVWKGQSIRYIASQTDHTVHGFDSFVGLPEEYTNLPKGTFKMDGLPKVPKNVQLHKGWFDKTLPGWVKEHPEPVAFLHLDADLYSSTKTVLDILGGQIVGGTVIEFDEFFNHPGWQHDEFKAFQEFVAARHVKFEYLGYTEDQQLAVRILSVGAPDQKAANP